MLFSKLVLLPELFILRFHIFKLLLVSRQCLSDRFLKLEELFDALIEPICLLLLLLHQLFIISISLLKFLVKLLFLSLKRLNALQEAFTFLHQVIIVSLKTSIRLLKVFNVAL